MVDTPGLRENGPSFLIQSLLAITFTVSKERFSSPAPTDPLTHKEASPVYRNIALRVNY